VTAPPAHPVEGLPLHPKVDALIRVAAERFSDLGYLGPDGMLDLPLDGGRVLGLRIELPAGQVLHLQSIGIDAKGVPDVGEVADVRASSWQGVQEPAFEPARLFEIDHPTGTVIRTGADRPAWVEIRFSRPLAVTRLRLRNVSDETARRARGLKITMKWRWRSRAIYDGEARRRAWLDLLSDARAGAGSDAETLALLDVLDLTVRGEYARAHTSLAAHVPDEQRRRRFIAALNDELLPARGLEWTAHGPKRPFRSWSHEEQVDYVRDTADVVEALRSLTPNVCFGFGSVLAAVRDRALIPHDDDLDVIIGFEPDEAATLADGLHRIEEHLRPLGFEVAGPFVAHRHVRRPGRKRVDIFVGVFEGEAISWYPGARGGLTRTIVFPPNPARLLGVPCLIPAQPEAYLERLYGQGWRVPDPYFRHDWNSSTYADIKGTSAAASPDPDPS
jgi:hypothetical protein